MKPLGRPAGLMIVSLLVTAVLYAIPFGRTLAWPLVLLSTLAHELGHGLAAAVLGGKFEALRMYPDASGVALWRGALGRFAVWTVAGAGLVGPALAAFCLLAFGRTPRGAKAMLGCIGTALIVIALLVAGNAFALVFIVILAVALLVAVQLALAVFSRSDYLFTPTARTASGTAPSDVAVMASALFLPYWFWGALCGGLSLLLLAAGAKRFFR